MSIQTEQETKDPLAIAVGECRVYIGRAVSEIFHRELHGYPAARLFYGHSEIVVRFPKEEAFVQSPLTGMKFSTHYQPQRAAHAAALRAISERTWQTALRKGIVCEA